MTRRKGASRRVWTTTEKVLVIALAVVMTVYWTGGWWSELIGSW